MIPNHETGDGMGIHIDSHGAGLSHPVWQTLDDHRERLDSISYRQQVLEGRLEEIAQSNARLSRQSESAVAADAVTSPPTGTAVVVYCLGSFQLRINDVAVADWSSGRARALFQYLVNHSNRPATRTSLIDALWPDPTAKAADGSLKVAAHALRQMFAALDVDSEVLNVVTCSDGYRLDVADIWLDVDEFERFCHQAQVLAYQGATQRAESLLTRAVDLYRGDFLEEAWDEWAVFRRESLKDQFLMALSHLMLAEFARGDLHGCIRHCQQAIAKDHCREDAYQLLIQCFARLGQKGRARRWYDLCTQVLQNELDVEPHAVTKRIFREAMCS